jgi:PKD repeat protein
MTKFFQEFGVIGIICCIFNVTGFAQLNFELDPCQNCTATYPTYTAPVILNGSNVTEDFGRREIDGISKWHKGLDVNGPPEGGATGDHGYHIRSIAAGTISRIYRGTYKVIAIRGGDANHSFAYGHIFNDSGPARVGDMVIAGLSSNETGDSYNAIIYDPANASDSYCLTDAPLDGSESDANYFMTYTRPDGSTITFTTTGVNRLRNTVSAGDIIAPLGGSGGFSTAPHVHLYSFVNAPTSVLDFQEVANNKNPLQYLNYTEPATVTNSLSIARGSSIINGVGPFYGSINFKAKVRFHPTRYAAGTNRYTTTSPVFDVDKVEVLLRKDYVLHPYSLMRGPYFESKINYGGKRGEGRYPSHGIPGNNIEGGDVAGSGVDITQVKDSDATSAGFGSYRKTGVYSRAYLDYLTGDELTSHAYDEFYLNEYNTRIHKNDNYGRATPVLAFRSEDCRYPDGPYILKVRSTSITDATFDSPERTIHIDNFRPFVARVEGIINYDYPPISRTGYDREWSYNSGANTQTLGANSASGALSAGDDLTIMVTASESLQSLAITISSLGIVDQQMEGILGGSWKYRIPMAQVISGTHQLVFEGIDFGGNQLMGTPDRIGYRDDAGVWQNMPTSASTEDRNHTITIGSGSSCEDEGRIAGGCVLDAFFVHNVNGANPMIVSFYDQSSPSAEITKWQWDFGDGTSSLLQNPSHTYTTPGDYWVTLTIWRGIESTSYGKAIVVGNILNPVITADKTSGPVSLLVAFNSDQSTGPITSRTWSVESSTNSGYQYVNGTTNHSVYPQIEFFDPGTYRVKLTISDGVDWAESEELTILAQSSVELSVDFTYAPSPSYINSYATFTNTSNFNCNGFIDYEWQFTDPSGWSSSPLYGEDVDFFFTSSGSWQVKLCMIDQCHSTPTCKTKTIWVQEEEPLRVTAAFTASTNTVREGKTVNFYDASFPRSDIKYWSWWFNYTGNNEYSDEGYRSFREMVSKTFETAGTYNVRLGVSQTWSLSNTAGPQSTADKIIEVTETPVIPPGHVAQELETYTSGKLMLSAHIEQNLYAYLQAQGDYMLKIFKKAGDAGNTTWNPMGYYTTLSGSTNTMSLNDFRMKGNNILLQKSESSSRYSYILLEGVGVSNSQLSHSSNNILPLSLFLSVKGGVEETPTFDLNGTEVVTLQHHTDNSIYLYYLQRGASGYTTTVKTKIADAGAYGRVFIDNNSIVLLAAGKIHVFEKAGGVWDFGSKKVIDGVNGVAFSDMSYSSNAIVASLATCSGIQNPLLYVFEKTEITWPAIITPTAQLSLDIDEHLKSTTVVCPGIPPLATGETLTIDKPYSITSSPKKISVYVALTNGSEVIDKTYVFKKWSSTWNNSIQTYKIDREAEAFFNIETSDDDLLMARWWGDNGPGPGRIEIYNYHSYCQSAYSPLVDQTFTINDTHGDQKHSMIELGGSTTLDGAYFGPDASRSYITYYGSITLKKNLTAKEGAEVTFKAAACDDLYYKNGQ